MEKKNFIIFHPMNSEIDQSPVIEIGKKAVQRAEFVHFLQLILDEDLTWKSHRRTLSKKLVRICDAISTAKNLLSTDVLLCLYDSLFMPFAQYGTAARGNVIAFYIDSVYKLQTKQVRIISSQPACSPSALISKPLHLLRPSDVFQFKLLTFVFETVPRISPSCFHDFFIMNSSVYNSSQASEGCFCLAQK